MDFSWMHPSPERPHVMQRVADRAATAAGSTATALRQQQDLQHVIAPAVDDTDPELRLTQQQRLGLITLIYKGGGKPSTDPASYRPITHLTCDLKVVAKAMVHRFGPACASIIDSTQTAFIPGRDIADNVLHHLEEIDYLEEVQQPGCIVFLDFGKAYD